MDEAFELGFSGDPVGFAAGEVVEAGEFLGDFFQRAQNGVRSEVKAAKNGLEPFIRGADEAARRELDAIRDDLGLIAGGFPLPQGTNACDLPDGTNLGNGWCIDYSVPGCLTPCGADQPPINPDLPVCDPTDPTRCVPDGPFPQPEPEPPTPETCPSCGCCPCGCPEPECPTDEPQPEDEYCCWGNSETCESQVLSVEQQQPPAPGWQRISCHPTWELANSACFTWKTKCEGNQDPPIPVGTANEGRDLCNTLIISDPEELKAEIKKMSLSGTSIMEGFAPNDLVVNGLTNALGSVLPSFIKGDIREQVQKAVDWFTQLVWGPTEESRVVSGCNTPEYDAISTWNMFLSFIQKWTVNLPQKVQASNTYAENYACPWELPKTDEADNAWLGATINQETHTNLVSLNGRCPDIHRAILDSKRRKITPIDSVALQARDYWPNTRAAEEIRAQGFIREEDKGAFEALFKFIPGPADLVRFMQRDVFDEEIVQRFGLSGLDAQRSTLEYKLSSVARGFAKASGVSEEILEYYWRAHWQLPSEIRLREFAQRLRKIGSGDIPERARRVGVTRIPSDSPRLNEDAAVTLDDIRTALIQDDHAPGWIESYMATLYQPLTRVDVRRAFRLGVVDVNDVFESLLADGYSSDNAAILTEFAQEEKNLSIPESEPYKFYVQGLSSLAEAATELKERGFPEEKVLDYLTKARRQKMIAGRSLDSFRLYVSGEGSEEELRFDLEDRFYDEVEISELIQRAQRQISARNRTICASGIHEQFLRGNINQDQAKQRLTEIGYNEFYASDLVKNWACELASRDRVPALRQAAELYDAGIYDEEQLTTNLRNLRYSPANVDRVIAQINIRRAINQQRSEQQRIRNEEAAVAKRRRDEERRRKDRQRQSDKTRKTLKAAKTLRERLAIQIQKAAEKWSLNQSLPLSAGLNQLQDQAARIRNEYDFDPATTTQVLVRAVDYLGRLESNDLETAVDLIAEEIVESAAVVG